MAIVHPRATERTAKQLYADAVICAHPDCSKPLFIDAADGTGRRLNSRIAHICARREGGPRFDPTMSAEDNRAAANLLVLCLDHADEIDRPELVAAFPVEVLQAWKSAQVGAAAQAASRCELTDEEATEVVETSFPPTTITIQGETVMLGGLGGVYGGAGGGGAAVGPGAIGGRGGDNVKIDLPGRPGVAPGGGGGSGGTLAPGAVVPDPALTAATEGEGYSVGADGGDGEDTTFSDGETVLVRATGGKGELAGTGVRLESDRFSVSTMSFVKSAERVSGLFYTLGAGCSSVQALNLRDEVRVGLILVFEAGGVPVGEYTGSVKSQDPAGTERLRLRFPITVTKTGDILRLVRIDTLAFELTQFGLWTFTAGTDRELARHTLLVKRAGEADAE